MAHPKDFPTLSKYLIYCGYKGISRKTNRFSRKAKYIVWNITKNILMAKNEKYYPLYLKIKEQIKKKGLTCSSCFRKGCKKRDPNRPICNGRIDEMAWNRVGTLILKEIYYRIRSKLEEVERLLGSVGLFRN